MLNAKVRQVMLLDDTVAEIMKAAEDEAAAAAVLSEAKDSKEEEEEEKDTEFPTDELMNHEAAVKEAEHDGIHTVFLIRHIY